MSAGRTETRVNPGALRHYLTIERPLEVPDGAGGMSRAFVMLDAVWGLIEPMSGTELRSEDRLVQRLTQRITIRTFPGLTAAHRFTRCGRAYEIRAVREDVPARGYMTCHCEETLP